MRRRYPVSTQAIQMLSAMVAGVKYTSGELATITGQETKRAGQMLQRLYERGYVYRAGDSTGYRFELGTAGAEIVHLSGPAKRRHAVTRPAAVGAVEAVRSLFAGFPVRAHLCSDEERRT